MTNPQPDEIERVRLSNTDGPACPYCGHVETPDEPHYFDESTTSLSCGDCGADYAVEIYHETTWTTRAALTDKPVEAKP